MGCTAVDEVVDRAVAAGIASLATVGWGMLGGLGVVDGCAKHGDWEEKSWEERPKAVAVGSEGGSRTARTPSYVRRLRAAGPDRFAVGLMQLRGTAERVWVSLPSIEDWSLPETAFFSARDGRAYWVFAVSSQSAGLSGRDYGGQDWSARTRESAALLDGCYLRYVKLPTAVTATRGGPDDIKVVVDFASVQEFPRRKGVDRFCDL